MLRIGITGGIGSGKSMVCRLFQVLGAPVYDSDARAKWLMGHDATLRDELTAAFGSTTFDSAGQLDRVYLARVAFAEPTQLARLNALVHPAVGRDFDDCHGTMFQNGGRDAQVPVARLRFTVQPFAEVAMSLQCLGYQIGEIAQELTLRRCQIGHAL